MMLGLSPEPEDHSVLPALATLGALLIGLFAWQMGHLGTGAPALTADLHFQGNPSGRFRVSVTMKLARVVGAGFLGREEAEVTDSQAGEVVCELANMICGSVLSRLENKTTFQITHPELTPSEPVACFDGDSACRWFDLGDGLLITSLELQQVV